MNYLAILRDSLRETLDRKSLYFLLVISVLLIGVCASTGFRELDAAGALGHVVSNFNHVWKFEAGKSLTYQYDVTFDVSDVREMERESARSAAEYAFTLTAKPVAEFHRAVLTWNALESGKLKKEGDPIEGISGDKVADPGSESEMRFLRAKFREQMINRVDIEAGKPSAGERAFRVDLRTSSRFTLEGAHEISLFFGAWKDRLPWSLAVYLILVEVIVAQWVAGFFGVILAVIFTAGFVPAMLQKGTLDLLLAKPVRRPLVLLTKYAGGLFYVLIPATLLIGGCWLMISWRSGYFNYGFLVSIVVLGIVFAVLYSFTLLMGVLTRSTIASILLTIGLWFLSSMVANGYLILRSPEIAPKVPAAITKAAGVIRLGLPRTAEWGRVSDHFIVKTNLGPEMEMVLEDQGRRGIEKPDWLSLGLSSAGFIAVMLGLACWSFSRKDY
ncbi:MAG TPA: ABC transporter permease [Planctomycetota bacterium]|jgi:ABC-type transport system involved in multi-copper enzyme maturation permease subunit